MSEKVAIITGGSRGIGKAIAEELARAGYTLLLVARDAERLAAVASELQTTYTVAAFPFAVDLSDDASGTAIASEARRRGLVPDVLVLNAGIYAEADLPTPHLRDAPFAALEATFKVNCFSAFHCVQALLGDLRKGMGKRIIIIGSTAAYEPYPVGALYGMSKWGLRGFAMNLREELKTMDVGVTFVAPGGTLTDLWAGEDLPPKRLLEPSDIGRVVRMIVELSSQAVVEEIIVRPMLGDMHD